VRREDAGREAPEPVNAFQIPRLRARRRCGQGWGWRGRGAGEAERGGPGPGPSAGRSGVVGGGRVGAGGARPARTPFFPSAEGAGGAASAPPS
jgi:hypothetical protein